MRDALFWWNAWHLLTRVAKRQQKMNTQSAEELGDGLISSGGEELLKEVTELNLRLEGYASVNAVLEERLAASESENKRLRLENELLSEQLRNRDCAHDLHYVRSSFTNNCCCEQKEYQRKLQADTAVAADGDEYSGQLAGKGKEEKMRAASMTATWQLDAETANQLQAALEDAPLHMSYCDSDLRYVWLNHAVGKVTHQEMVGKRDEEIFGGESEGVRQLITLKHKAMQTGLTQVGQVTLDWPGEGCVTWMVTCRPHPSSDGLHVAGLSTASIDITEQVEIKKCLTKLCAEMTARKATEDELRRAVQVAEDAIQAKNVFLAIMSHEIRTPLNGLLGLAEALESLELSGEQRELVSAILSSGVIVADILSDILDLASMEFAGLELEERPFDLSEIIQDIMKMAVAATRGKDVAVISEVVNALPRQMIGDAVRIRQIIKYLVLNAIKFTRKGNVWIRTKVDHSDSLQLPQPAILEEEHVPVHSTCNSSYQQCNHQSEVILYCEVVDTGVGIPEEAFATLFDKFKQVSEGTTRSFGGTGLGLSLCKRLVEFMGGQLHVRSEVGKGSTFAFTVMCKTMSEEGFEQGGMQREREDAEAADSSSSRWSCSVRGEESTATAGDSGPRILLAEDNQVNVMVAISMLKRLGFTAKVVANGVEALDAIRKDRYDLVLLDICMPLMDGLQVAHAIRCFEQTGEWPADLASVDPHHPSRSSSGPPHHRLPIVAVTANALRSDVDKYLAHGMDAFIAKPVVFQKLQEILHRYLPIPRPSTSSPS